MTLSGAPAFAVQDFKKRPDGAYDPADLAKLVDVNLTNLKDWNSSPP